jgi:hypothetical protein
VGSGVSTEGVDMFFKELYNVRKDNSTKSNIERRKREKASEGACFYMTYGDTIT